MNRKLLAAALLKCKNENGQVDPEILVEQARDPKHPFHDQFEWDDAIAAHEHRKEKARQLIKSLKSIVVYEEKVIAVPYYVSDPREKRTGYTPTMTIKKNRETSMAVLNDELARIKGALHRAIGLAVTFGLKKEFDVLLKEVVELESKLSSWPDKDE